MDADDLRNLGSVETAKAGIRDLRVKIDERMAELHEKIGRIRHNAKEDEREAAERAYAEIAPLRRQMEAMIQSVASVEMLTMPAPTIRFLDETNGGGDYSSCKPPGTSRSICNLWGWKRRILSGLDSTGLKRLDGYPTRRRVVRLLGMVLDRLRGSAAYATVKWYRPPSPARPAIADFPIGPAKQSPTKRLWPFYLLLRFFN